MSELQRLKGLLPPEMQSWVFVEAAASADPPLITIEEIGRDEVEIQVDLEKWDQLFHVNVRGVWILTQKVANLMRGQGGGNIINISSVMGFRGSDERVHPAVPYNSTKAAINLLTMNLAVKLAPWRIRVNAIAPGFFRTDMMAYIEKPEFKAAYDMTLACIPLGRIGDSDDMKGLAVFLASDASAYMTGQIIVNDGGLLAK